MFQTDLKLNVTLFYLVVFAKLFKDVLQSIFSNTLARYRRDGKNTGSRGDLRIASLKGNQIGPYSKNLL